LGSGPFLLGPNFTKSIGNCANEFVLDTSKSLRTESRILKEQYKVSKVKYQSHNTSSMRARNINNNLVDLKSSQLPKTICRAREPIQQSLAILELPTNPKDLQLAGLHKNFLDICHILLPATQLPIQPLHLRQPCFGNPTTLRMVFSLLRNGELLPSLLYTVIAALIMRRQIKANLSVLLIGMRA